MLVIKTETTRNFSMCYVYWPLWNKKKCLVHGNITPYKKFGPNGQDKFALHVPTLPAVYPSQSMYWGEEDLFSHVNVQIFCFVEAWGSLELQLPLQAQQVLVLPSQYHSLPDLPIQEKIFLSEWGTDGQTLPLWQKMDQSPLFSV